MVRCMPARRPKQPSNLACAASLPRALCSVLEIWGAEYQENDCLLIKPEARPLLEQICARERCIMQARARWGRGGRRRASRLACRVALGSRPSWRMLLVTSTSAGAAQLK